MAVDTAACLAPTFQFPTGNQDILLLNSFLSVDMKLGTNSQCVSALYNSENGKKCLNFKK